jgi:Ca2+-binding EF-hand superfamily protein
MAPLTDQQIADCKEAFALFDQVGAGRRTVFATARV